jgi:hypothetical protein
VRRSFVVSAAIYGRGRGRVGIEVAPAGAAFGDIFWRFGLLLITTATGVSYALRLARAAFWLAVVFFDVPGRFAMQALIAMIVFANGRMIPPMGVAIV